MALCVGVPAAELDVLWQGTRQRVSRVQPTT